MANRYISRQSLKYVGLTIAACVIFYEIKWMRQHTEVIKRKVLFKPGSLFKTEPFTIERQSDLLKTLVIPGFLSYPERKPLRLNCSDCAFVTSSGHLLNKGLGKVIDSHSCVIRSNDAPTTSYESDVGSRTTVRVLSAFSIKLLEKLVKKVPLFDRTVTSESVIIISGSTLGDVKAELLASIRSTCPNIQIYNQTYNYTRHVIKEYQTQLTHSSNALKRTGQSNGFVSMLFAHEVCGSIHVYGMVDPKYCERKFAANETDTVPYHYYQKEPKECANYARKNIGHDFVAEKEVFRAWRDKFKNIHFHFPEW